MAEKSAVKAVAVTATVVCVVPPLAPPVVLVDESLLHATRMTAAPTLVATDIACFRLNFMCFLLIEDRVRGVFTSGKA